MDFFPACFYTNLYSDGFLINDSLHIYIVVYGSVCGLSYIT